jgi:hypothetical protein
MDYKEPVMILAVEKKPRPKDDFYGTFTVERFNGETCANYPGYLLKTSEDSDGSQK